MSKNPKHAQGVKKYPMSPVPARVLAELGVAMLEGELKYGFHNFRDTDIDAKTYYDACNRHMQSWWEGQDIDPGSGLSHVTKAIATLVVLRDSMISGMLHDNRPPKSEEGWEDELNKVAEELYKKYHPKVVCDMGGDLDILLLKTEGSDE